MHMGNKNWPDTYDIKGCRYSYSTEYNDAIYSHLLIQAEKLLFVNSTVQKTFTLMFSVIYESG